MSTVWKDPRNTNRNAFSVLIGGIIPKTRERKVQGEQQNLVKFVIQRREHYVLPIEDACAEAVILPNKEAYKFQYADETVTVDTSEPVEIPPSLMHLSAEKIAQRMGFAVAKPARQNLN